MKLKELQKQKVAILGLGVEGIAMAEYFLEHKITFAVLDEKPEGELQKVGEEWVEIINKLKRKGIKLMLGQELSNRIVEQFDVIVRSPGVSLKKQYLEGYKGEMTSSTKLFFDNCPAKIIGVTGTKGKGTTSTLIYEMLKKGGFDAYLGGNIGKPPITFLDTLTSQSIVVLELSSFQLEDMKKSPNIAVMLMVTQEHLDSFGNQNYHKTIEDYQDAKRNIVRWQTPDDIAILNIDYDASRKSSEKTVAKVAWVSRYQEVENGCFVRDKEVILKMKSWGPATSHPTPMASFMTVQSRHASGVSSRVTPSDFETKVIDISEILLPGGHNLENVCAATTAAFSMGVSIPDIVFVLKTFKGLEHRLELVREVEGVRYYDDSFSTVPETAIAAIQAFIEPEILILGGSSKGSDFTKLGEVISKAQNIKAIIGIGIEWGRINSEIQKFRNSENRKQILIVEGLRDMKSIVRACQELAAPGDVVLLSPACASFDMFKNYKDRGDQFKKEVFKF